MISNNKNEMFKTSSSVSAFIVQMTVSDTSLNVKTVTLKPVISKNANESVP